jgi:hypothetical protein
MGACRIPPIPTIVAAQAESEVFGKIRAAPDAQLESLARECGELPETELFVTEQIPPSETNSK